MTQPEALDVLKTGANVFLTGAPGAGKTYVLNGYISWCREAKLKVATTASTGIAATHIGGVTIHSWSGIGIADTLSAHDIDRIASREMVVKRIRRAHVLVIDEISMLGGQVLEMVDRVCKAVRQSAEPFGGLQTVVVGDFFQLPPITRKGEEARFAFQSVAWEEARFLVCYLSEQYRHNDELLSSLLSSLRRGEVDQTHYTLLAQQTDIAYENIVPTRLFAHNKEVDERNERELRTLPSKEYTYTMTSHGNQQIAQSLMKSCLSPETLVLKREAMVMCTKNNFDAGFANGTLGRVCDFEPDNGYPVIETGDGRHITIEPMSWSVTEEGKVRAEIIQVPLRLAWAITIHKSQGMSLDAAEIDLRGAFTYGQGYVALSRVRTLSGMRILGVNEHALLVSPVIIAADSAFCTASEAVVRQFQNEPGEAVLAMHRNFVATCGGVYPKRAQMRAKEKEKTLAKRSVQSTYDETHALLREGMDVASIARARHLAQTTVWTHLETLAHRGVLTTTQIKTLTPDTPAWKRAYKTLSGIMDDIGTEKLKPVYEAAGERYDYHTIRLARLLYQRR